MGKVRLYEPYGFHENQIYESKRWQIEDDLRASRENDALEFTQISYDKDHLRFVFYNVKGEAKGYANMSDIIPKDFIKSATYDKDQKEIVMVFQNGEVVKFSVDDLIDVNEAGSGLTVIDGQINVVKDEASEDFLAVGEDTIAVVGVQDAINVERDRAISAETAETNRATVQEETLFDSLAAEITNRINGDNRIESKFDQALGEGFSSAHTVSYAILKETDARVSEDAELDTKIDNEVNARTADIASVMNEFTSRDTKISNLSTSIATEESNRETADNAIQAALDAEVNSRSTADSAEKVARESADDALEDKIDAEATARESGDNALDSRIKAEAEARESGDDSLQNSISDEITNRKEAVQIVKDDVSSIQTNISNLQSVIDELKTSISKLESRVVALEAKE